MNRPNNKQEDSSSDTDRKIRITTAIYNGTFKVSDFLHEVPTNCCVFHGTPHSSEECSNIKRYRSNYLLKLQQTNQPNLSTTQSTTSSTIRPPSTINTYHRPRTSPSTSFTNPNSPPLTSPAPPVARTTTHILPSTNSDPPPNDPS